MEPTVGAKFYSPSAHHRSCLCHTIRYEAAEEAFWRVCYNPFIANNQYIKSGGLRSYKYNFAESSVLLDCSFCGICHLPLFVMDSKNETTIILKTSTMDEATELES